MSISTIVGQPGVTTARTATPRRVLLGTNEWFLPSSKIIDGSLSRDVGNTGNLDVLRAGKLMGKITSGGKYRPSIIGGINGAISGAAGITSVTVIAAVATEVARLITVAGGNVNLKLTGPPAANGVVATTAITATAASGTTITVTSVTLPSLVTGSFITPADGSETPATFIYDLYGLKITDEFGVSQDTTLARFPVAGLVDSSQLIDWPSDTSLQAWIWARLNSIDMGKFVPDHNY